MISVIIPAYNEENTINEIINRVLKVKIDKEVIVVDDGSVDRTPEILKELEKEKKIKLITLKRNYGKGFAIRKGLEEAKGEIIIIQDADLELNPSDYYKLIEPLKKNECDIVYGVRFGYRKNWQGYRFISWVGNTVVTFFTNFLYNANLSDEATGYKVFKKSVLEKIKLECIGFEFCPEFTAKALRNKFKIKEVPVEFNPRTYVEGKKIGWKDGFIALWVLLKERFKK